MNTNLGVELQKKSNYSFMYPTNRANASIQLALTFAKEEGIRTIYIPESGGWMLYEKFIKKAGLEVGIIPTIDEQLQLNKLTFDNTCGILIHSLAGYHTTINTKQIREIADSANALFIEDACGTFGNLSMHGHIVLGSFGNAKPLGIGKGGFIGTNDKNIATFLEEHVTSNLTENEKKQIADNVAHAKERFTFFFGKRDEILAIIPDQNKIIGDENALVVVVEYKNENEKQKLVDIATQKHIDFTECPRYIRHNKQAISIEIKRLQPE